MALHSRSPAPLSSGHISTINLRNRTCFLLLFSASPLQHLQSIIWLWQVSALTACIYFKSFLPVLTWKFETSLLRKVPVWEYPISLQSNHTRISFDILNTVSSAINFLKKRFVIVSSLTMCSLIYLSFYLNLTCSSLFSSSFLTQTGFPVFEGRHLGASSLL